MYRAVPGFTTQIGLSVDTRGARVITRALADPFKSLVVGYIPQLRVVLLSTPSYRESPLCVCLRFLLHIPLASGTRGARTLVSHP